MTAQIDTNCIYECIWPIYFIHALRSRQIVLFNLSEICQTHNDEHWGQQQEPDRYDENAETSGYGLYDI